MTYNGDIDKLLSAYLDDQLGARQKTEVKRLLKHDRQITERLQYLRNCRLLLQTLPKEQAPDDTFEKIQQKLHGRHDEELLTRNYYNQEEGVKHLRVRKYIARAAMITLAAILGIVVYSIISPAENDKVIISDNWLNNKKIQTASASDTVKPGTSITAAGKDDKNPKADERTFSGKLVINTSEFDGVDAFIKKSLVDNGVMLIELPVRTNQQGLYTVHCSRMELSMVLADMSSIWDKFDSTRLIVNTDSNGPVIINNVLAQQIDQITTERDFAESIKIAKSISTLNSLPGHLTGQDKFAASNPPALDSIAIPKPILTGPDKNVPAKADKNKTEIVEFIIEVIPVK